jgi:hypothetical protein
MVGKMRKITEFREHAAECRKMALQARGALRKEELEGNGPGLGAACGHAEGAGGAPAYAKSD